MVYNCCTCNYSTNTNCNYKKHLATAKHILKTANNTNNLDIADNPDNATVADKPEITVRELTDKIINIEQTNKDLQDKFNLLESEDIPQIREQIDYLINSMSSLRILVKDRLNIYIHNGETKQLF